MPTQFASIESFHDHGKVTAACGHEVDVRSLAFVHRFRRGIEVAVETSCLKCAEDLPDYIHVKRRYTVDSDGNT